MRLVLLVERPGGLGEGDGVLRRSVGTVCKLKWVPDVRKGGADVGSD